MNQVRLKPQKNKWGEKTLITKLLILALFIISKKSLSTYLPTSQDNKMSLKVLGTKKVEKF